MSHLRLNPSTLLFLIALASCSSQRSSQEIPAASGSFAELETIAPARTPAAETPAYTGQAAYRIVNYSVPEKDFNVDEDLTVLSD